MSEELVALAEDCVVRGAVELPEGRLSDVVNALDLVQFRPARVEALDDGRVIEMEELEVERRDLHLMLARGREGDPTRRVRTVKEQVVMEIGPFTVTGHLHRPPASGPLAAVHGYARFIPVTEAAYAVHGGAPSVHDGAILVNRELITKIDLVNPIPSFSLNDTFAAG